MKKLFLLAGLAALAAAPAMAQVDITPENYHFNTAKKLPLYSKGMHGANIQGIADESGKTMLACAAPIWETAIAQGFGMDKEYDGGLLVIGGGQFWNPANGYFDAAKDGVGLVNLGGEVGQVLAIIGEKCDIADVLEEQTGFKYELPKASHNEKSMNEEGNSLSNWGNLNFFFDPETCPTKTKGYMTIKITYHAYMPTFDGEAQAITNVYMKNNQNDWVMYTADGIPYNHFFEENEDEDMVHNPELWKTLTFDYVVADEEDGKVRTPARLTLNFSGNFFPGNGALFIKDITVLQNEPDEEFVNNELSVANFKAETLTLSKGDPSAAVAAVEADENAPVEYFNLQGIRVANPENGLFIRRQGNKATKVVL